MRLERTKNTKRNLVWGFTNKVIKIVCPFIIRTIVIKKLGIEYLGINSFCSSILNVLSLAELGFDTAIVYVMYGAIAEDNNEMLCALFGYLKKIYIIIGVVILSLGISCMPFLSFLIEDISKIPKEINIYYVYFFFLMQTVISYFFGGYRNSIINAHQRQDIISNVMSITTLVSFVLQVLLLCLYENYYMYVYTLPITTFLTNVLVIYLSRKMYPSITPGDKLPQSERKELKKIVQGCFFSKIGSVLSVSFDNVVISTFLGLTLLAYYSNYLYIITAIQGFLIVIYTSIQAGIGNRLILENVDSNYQNMRCMTFIYNWIVGWCAYCLFFLMEPFVLLWIGEEGILSQIVLLMVCINFYISNCDAILGTYKAGLGIWWQDRYRCIVGGIFNLIINIFIVLTLKTYSYEVALAGVVVSTILSQILILTPWCTWLTFKEYFKNGMKEYYFQLLLFFVVVVITVLVSNLVFFRIPDLEGVAGYKNLILKGIICIFFPNIVWYLIFHKSKIYGDAKRFLASKFFYKG